MVLEHYSQWLLMNQILYAQATQAQWSVQWFTLCGVVLQHITTNSILEVKLLLIHLIC